MDSPQELFNLYLLTNNSYGTALIRHSRESVLLWDSLLETPLPEGTSAKQIWEAIRGYRHAESIKLPFHYSGEGHTWYTLTYELQALITALEHGCNERSEIAQQLARSSDRHFLTKLRISDSIASLSLDGIHVPEDEADRLLHYEKSPQSAAEQLIVNIFGILEDLEQYKGERFSQALLEHFRDRIAENVTIEDLKTRPRSTGISPSLSRLSSLGISAKLGQSSFETTLAYANDDEGDPYDSRVLRSLILGDVLHSYSPLGPLSGQAGKIMSRLYALKHDLPVLTILPLAQAQISWGEGALNSPLVTYSRHDLESNALHTTTNQDADITLYQTVSAQLALHQLADLTNSIASWKNRDDEMRVILQHDPSLNQRQRSILSRALRHPDATFTIKYHQMNHAIVYSTARHDLYELMEKGYLTFFMRGRAMVFKAADDLEKQIGVPKGGE